MKVSGQFHDPAALLAEKEPPVPIRQEAGWDPTAGLDTVEKRKISCLWLSLLQNSVELKYAWKYTSIPPYVFMAC
jgi:hypothetical protein